MAVEARAIALVDSPALPRIEAGRTGYHLPWQPTALPGIEAGRAGYHLRWQPGARATTFGGSRALATTFGGPSAMAFVGTVGSDDEG